MNLSHSLRTLAAMGILTLAACSSDAVPTPPPPPAAKPNNPFAGTIYESQGDALDKARGVQDTLDQSAQQRRDEIDKSE